MSSCENPYWLVLPFLVRGPAVWPSRHIQSLSEWPLLLLRRWARPPHCFRFVFGFKGFCVFHLFRQGFGHPAWKKNSSQASAFLSGVCDSSWSADFMEALTSLGFLAVSSLGMTDLSSLMNEMSHTQVTQASKEGRGTVMKGKQKERHKQIDTLPAFWSR